MTEQDHAAYRLGLRDGMRAAAALLGMTTGDILLTCGEMTAQEMRTVKAVLEWRKAAILRKAEEAAHAG